MKDFLFIRPFTQYSGWQKPVSQPLGIMYLTAVIKRDGWRVRAVDGLIDHRWRRRVREEIARQRPAVIGFSMLSLDIDEAASVTREIRAAGFTGPILGGGPGATYADDTAKKHLGFDVFIHGEAERTLPEWLKSREQGGDALTVPGLTTARDGGWTTTAPRSLIEDLDALPFPDQTILPPERYFGRPTMDMMYRSRRWSSIQTSRSCPFNCAYCAHAQGRGYRPRSVPNILAEIDELAVRFRIGELQIVDDIFNLERERTLHFCAELRARPYRLHLVFPNGLRLDRLDVETITALRAAGFDRLLAPIETASARLQQEMGKNLDLEKAMAAVREMARQGVLIRLATMLGFPGETYEEMRATMRLALRSPAQLISINRVMPLPGSRLGGQLTWTDGQRDWQRLNYLNTSLNLSPVPTAKIERLIRRTFLRSQTPKRLFRLLRALPKNSFPLYMQVFFSKLLPLGLRRPAANGRTDHSRGGTPSISRSGS